MAPILPSPLVPKAKDMESIPFHGLRETVTISSDDSTSNAQPPPTAHVDVSNQEELNILLERFPTFIDIELPASHMNELFSVLERIPVDVTADPQQISWLMSRMGPQMRPLK